MSHELLRVTIGRPSFVDDAGGRVCIAVHDEFYRRIRSDFRQRLKLAHPDMMPATTVSVSAGSRRAHAFTMAGQTTARRAHDYKAYVFRVKNRGGKFRRIRAAFATWLHREQAWYARYGLLPPSHKATGGSDVDHVSD